MKNYLLLIFLFLFLVRFECGELKTKNSHLINNEQLFLKTTPPNMDLILGLSIGIPVAFIVIFIILLILYRRYKRNKKKKKPSETTQAVDTSDNEKEVIVENEEDYDSEENDYVENYSENISDDFGKINTNVSSD
ncbi:myelin p0 related [Anaeramoeba flamelloides]|uniref:Myelin p0 related n=1 Tax=Anaeramoeba flamelloides TaxID=1746091 RepID=A0AAV7ZBV1_9EUKA|nr:myelin p0 related [Anaeramoeba flamelloides]